MYVHEKTLSTLTDLLQEPSVQILVATDKVGSAGSEIQSLGWIDYYILTHG